MCTVKYVQKNQNILFTFLLPSLLSTMTLCSLLKPAQCCVNIKHAHCFKGEISLLHKHTGGSQYTCVAAHTATEGFVDSVLIG